MSAPESFYCLEETEADKNFGLDDSHYSLPSLPMELEHFSAACFQVVDIYIYFIPKLLTNKLNGSSSTSHTAVTTVHCALGLLLVLFHLYFEVTVFCPFPMISF